MFLLSPLTNLDKVAVKPESAVTRTGLQSEDGASLTPPLHHHHAATELLDGDWTELPAVDIILEKLTKYIKFKY